MLDVRKSVLVVVDIQEKLAPAMPHIDALVAGVSRLLEAADRLGVPRLWTEQVPAKLGPTVPELKRRLEGVAAPVEKTAFSAWGDKAFRAAFRAAERTQAVLVGIESHVCVCQTALDLCSQSIEVFVVADAVSSRSLEDRERALQRMARHGAEVITAEMALFEWLRDARHEQFRAVHRACVV